MGLTNVQTPHYHSIINNPWSYSCSFSSSSYFSIFSTIYSSTSSVIFHPYTQTNNLSSFEKISYFGVKILPLFRFMISLISLMRSFFSTYSGILFMRRKRYHWPNGSGFWVILTPRKWSSIRNKTFIKLIIASMCSGKVYVLENCVNFLKITAAIYDKFCKISLYKAKGVFSSS